MVWERPDCIDRCDPGERFASAGGHLSIEFAVANPSSVADIVRATFFHKGSSRATVGEREVQASLVLRRRALQLDRNGQLIFSI